MDDLIPTTTEEILAIKEHSVDDESIAMAIAGVIRIACDRGQSLEELTAEVLAEDSILSRVQRNLLSQIISQAWHRLTVEGLIISPGS